MDSSIIQEIANQLGVAVDDAGSFIQQYLSQYASLQTFYNVMAAMFWVICIIVTVVVARKIFIHQVHDTDGDFCTVTIVIATIIVIVCIGSLVCNVGTAVGWAMFPEATLIDTVFDCVG